MVLSLVFPIIIEHSIDVTLHLFLLLVEIHHNIVILLLLFEISRIDSFNLFSEFSQFFDFGSELLLSVFDFLFNLSYSLCDFLQSLILLVIEDLFHIGDTLDLVFNVGIA